ncbi:anti-sigma factor domain-containing protein [Lacipirellula sp.]|uniref:anti-sigma factor n=1 Tax=Lacipirellula sp. TaxID=2691419 RepID=UPI003D0FEC4C
MITCDHCRNELAEHALGHLPAEIAAAVDSHLAACPVCRHEAAALVAAWSALPMTLEPAVPPRELFDRIASRLDDWGPHEREGSSSPRVVTQTSARSTLSSKQRVASYALAASIFVALTASFVHMIRPASDDARQSAHLEELAQEYRELLAREQKRPASSEFRLVQMKGPTAAKAFVIWDLPGEQWHVHVTGLPPVPAGQAYQLWALTKSNPLPGPTFEPNVDGVGSVVGGFPGLSPGDGVRAAVTLEPAGGSPHPTGAPLLEANL